MSMSIVLPGDDDFSIGKVYYSRLPENKQVHCTQPIYLPNVLPCAPKQNTNVYKYGGHEASFPHYINIYV